MKIKIDDSMYVEVAKNNFVLKRDRIVQNGKNKGATRSEVVAYCSTIKELLSVLLRLDMMVHTGFVSFATLYNDLESLINDRADKLKKINE